MPPLDALATVTRLRRLAVRLAAAKDEDAGWLGDTVEMWLGGVQWEAALGLGPHWRIELARARRNRAIAELLRYYPAASIRQRAKAVAQAVRRYETTGWKRDRQSGRRPDAARGALYDLLAIGAGVPDECQLRRIISEIDGASGAYGDAPPQSSESEIGSVRSDHAQQSS
jgi:hypothetical protein